MSSDASTFIAGTNKGYVYVYKVQQKGFEQFTSYRAHDKYLLRNILSPDGKSIATASADTSLKTWKLHFEDEGKTVIIDEDDMMGNSFVSLEKTLMGHQRWVWDCAFSADSEYLVSASSDHTARLWDLSTGETIRQYQGHHKAAVCVALNDMSQ
jgi:target of rapamycin complex subunit LST8